jgi:tetratricopeptide (TPR) repeat protein
MRYIYVILTVLILSSVCNAESSPNTPPVATLPASPNTALTQPPLLQTLPPIQTGLKPSMAPPPPVLNSDEAIRAERDAYKEIVKAHQETLNTIKWAIGIIGTLVLALMGYALFKDKKEYENALKGAEKACEKAEKWEEKARSTCNEIDTLVQGKLVEIEKTIEQKAQAVLDSIDKKAEAKLKNIGEKTQKSTQEIDAKAKKQMRITELWSDALRLQNKGRYAETCDKYDELVKLKPDDYWAFNNWGAELVNWAKIKIEKPEYESLLKQAEEKCLKAESLKTGAGAYNLACIYALRGNKEECKKWLLTGQEARTLFTRETAMEDKDLESVRNEQWFKEIKWKGER